MTLQLRDYQSGDETDVAYVCMKTGDHGQDGEPFFRSDPEALSRIYTTPYLRFAPEFAVLLADEQRVQGYVLAALDSRTFYDRYDREVRPDLCQRFAAPSGEPDAWNRLESVYHVYHHPDYFCPEPYASFPSHLHIDLLPQVQGKGWGRQMMEKTLRHLREQGSPGVHLGMSDRNQAAYGFYQALGFEELVRHDGAIYMGLRFAEAEDSVS